MAAVLLTLPAVAGAQDFNPQEKTFLTFSSAVELPGMTLPAGTYTFRLADTPSRNVVHVLSQDEKEVKGQFLFVQAQRPEVTGETVITFRETREGTTPAVQYWYYPGEKIGKEFIYSKDQAMQISARTGAAVMTADGPVSSNTTASATDAQGQVSELKREPASSNPAEATIAADANVNQPEPAAPVEVQADAQIEPPAAPELRADASINDNRAVGTSGVLDDQAAANRAPADELPRTASPLALSGLLGLLSLAGAIGLRSFRG